MKAVKFYLLHILQIQDTVRTGTQNSFTNKNIDGKLYMNKIIIIKL